MIHAELAREANLRGILTTRNNEWSRATVNRTLKKLAEYKADNQESGKS